MPRLRLNTRAYGHLVEWVDHLRLWRVVTPDGTQVLYSAPRKKEALAWCYAHSQDLNGRREAYLLKVGKQPSRFTYAQPPFHDLDDATIRAPSAAQGPAMRRPRRGRRVNQYVYGPMIRGGGQPREGMCEYLALVEWVDHLKLWQVVTPDGPEVLFTAPRKKEALAWCRFHWNQLYSRWRAYLDKVSHQDATGHGPITVSPNT